MLICMKDFNAIVNENYNISYSELILFIDLLLTFRMSYHNSTPNS
jgi:hypothetical protein